MLLRKLVVVGLAGMINFAAQIANAQEVTAPVAPQVALESVSFTDTASPINSFGDRFSLQVGPADEPRFANLAPASLPERNRDDRDRGYEVAVLARSANGFEMSAAQSGRFGFDANGDVERESRSSELRLGRGLQGLRSEAPRAPTWYVFVASEDEALTWRPGGQRSAFGVTPGGFALQDRVEIGDLQAGITYEANGIQASLAYVERDFSVTVGRENFSAEERFAGFTLTLRN